jgi:prepilin-type N-terminal cleavage/methylation domain-containing protein
MRMKRAFTLIELLIVVAIIAILAAIAIPNFMEAQMRARSSRTAADFRALCTALEAYCVDYSHFPPALQVGQATGNSWLKDMLFPLTTPVAYITNVALYDPFAEKEKIASGHGDRPLQGYNMYEPTFPRGATPRPGYGLDIMEAYIQYWLSEDRSRNHRCCMLTSVGPDRTETRLFDCEISPGYKKGPYPVDQYDYNNAVYDPTNGTVSSGDIGRRAGNPLNKTVKMLDNKS